MAALMLLALQLTAALPAPRIHFARDHYQISEAEQSKLTANVAWLKKNPQAVLILEGHCDTWGEVSYNLLLGDRRAREVKAYLIEQGIDAERIIMVVSFGEDRPIDPRPLPAAWASNRRVEFMVR